MMARQKVEMDRIRAEKEEAEKLRRKQQKDLKEGQVSAGQGPALT